MSTPIAKPITVGEERNISVTFAGKLDSGESLTGTPTVDILPVSSGLTVDNIRVNSAQIIIDNEFVGVGKAIQFRAIGAAEGKRYELRVFCLTDAVPPQKVIKHVALEGVRT